MPIPGISTLADMLVANQNLTSRSQSPGSVSTRIVSWLPETLPVTGATFQAIIGPDDCDLPGRQKYFRGFKAYGEPGGILTYLAFADGVQVATGTVRVDDDAAHDNQASFPRGTSGLEVILLVSCTARLDRIDNLYDPMGAIEED
jgi:hypothetical protein